MGSPVGCIVVRPDALICSTHMRVWMYRWMDEWVDGWMDGWMDG